jgi:hypothetical protein
MCGEQCLFGISQRTVHFELMNSESRGVHIKLTDSDDRSQLKHFSVC